MFTVHADGKSCWRSTWRPMKTATTTSARASTVAASRETSPSVHVDRRCSASLPVADAPRRRHPVEHDRQRDDGEAARERRAHVEVVEAVEHDLTETADPHGAAITTMPSAIMIV